jgi:cytochrome b
MMNKKIRVWDLPTRAFHWLLVAAYAGALLTSESEWLLEYHVAAGYVALGLVAFRILWGFAGNRFARFADFVKGLGAVVEYLLQAFRLHPRRFLGHNPAAGWMVLLLLLLTVAIAVTGIIVYAGEEMRGLFAGAFSYQTAQRARSIHLFLSYSAIFVIVIHIAVALFHEFFLNENIILSMFTGYKEDEESYGERVSHLHTGEILPPLRLVAYLFLTVMGGLGAIFLPPEGKTNISEFEQPKVFDPSGVAITVPESEAFRAECAETCHAAFHPTLMPSESWHRIMAGLEDHFGESVILDESGTAEILAYLLSAPAERSMTEASRKLAHSIRPGEIPIRITDIPYWVNKHSEISEEVYRRSSIVSRSNCVACHPGAEMGSFEDRDITIPKE